MELGWDGLNRSHCSSSSSDPVPVAVVHFHGAGLHATWGTAGAVPLAGGAAVLKGKRPLGVAST